MTRVVIDLETRSILDIEKCGIAPYAAHFSTTITHFGYKIDSEPAQVWQPRLGPAPEELLAILADPEIVLVAHNAAGFERQILGGPPGRQLGLDGTLRGLQRWSCTAARCAQVGLPRKLERAAEALRLPLRKDREGHSLMLRVSRPRTLDPLTWWDDDERMDRMGRYCVIDCEVEALLDQQLPPLTPFEHQVWLCTEQANDRGFGVDLPLLARLVELTAEARKALDAELFDLTDEKVPRVTNHAALTRWLRGKGVEVDGCAKDVIEELLLRDDLDDTVQAALELRQAGGGSSCKKASAITQRLSDDGRIRGSLVFGGAPSTLRFSSTGAQLQNLPRHDDRFNVDWLLRDVIDGATVDELGTFHGPPLKAVSELLRPVFVAREGLHFVIADYSQIEARILALLADQADRIEIFKAFDADPVRNPDPYKVTAGRIYRIAPQQIDKKQRLVGKTADLACGYQGGVRAFKKMAKVFGLKFKDAEAEEIKVAWREAHPAIVRFWHALEYAAFECVAHPPGQVFTVGRVSFTRSNRTLKLQLPSGRRLIYWSPSIQDTKTPWGDVRPQVHFWSQNSMTKKWEQFSLYGGLLAENVTQATARDVLADAFVRLTAGGFNPVLTVHDEVILETTATADTIAALMSIPPTWTNDLPLAVEVFSSPRYRKD